MQAIVPIPLISSSVTLSTTTSPLRRIPDFLMNSRALRIEAAPPFMSEVPRPYTRWFDTIPEKGSYVQPSSSPLASTTPMCKFNSNDLPPPQPPSLPTTIGLFLKVLLLRKLGYFLRELGSGSHMSTWAPNPFRRSAMKLWHSNSSIGFES